MAIEGRSTVYNQITSKEKLAEVNPQNIQLEEDFIEYLESIDRSKGTIEQYQSNLHIFWCWNLEYNYNKFFVDMTKREFAKFQNHAINEWHWSPKRVRTVKATISSLSNYIQNILDDEFQGYTPIIRKIESPANVPVREKSIFNFEELEIMLDTLVADKKYMNACIVALTMYSGRRKSEITRFKASYFSKKNLICGGSLYKTPEKIITKGRGQNGKLLYVYVLAKQFQPYLDMWIHERKELGITSDWLFPKYQNEHWLDEHIDISAIDTCMEHCSKILGKHIYPHALRHMFTTYLLEQNLPESVVQTILGWDSAEMVHVYDDRTNDELLEKYFGAEGIKNIEQKTLEDL